MRTFVVLHSRNVTLFETGKYTLAQVKQLVATGQLPFR